MEIAFIVDDNLIGNKQAIKAVLRSVIDWQQARGYPLTFFTEASLDLADDAELLQLMVDANISTVFVGIESPNEESLRETKKYQNVRQGRTSIERVHAIQNAGLDVWCGMIVGFDQTTTIDFRGPARLSEGGSRAACDGRHAFGNSQDSAARAAGRRRTT